MLMRMSLLGAAGAGLALLLFTGCSAGDSGSEVASISSPQAAPSEAAGPGKADSAADLDAERKYAKCMREHGIDMPDPSDDGAARMAIPMDDPKSKDALDACRKLLPGGGTPKKRSPEELDKARAQAKCMREHGIDMPDPGADNQAVTLPANGDSSTFEKAMKECGMGIVHK
jgi:hypothetical protein